MKCIYSDGLGRCRKEAMFFGCWTGGGLCLDHAIKDAREFGVEQFHALHRAKLQNEIVKMHAAEALANGQ